MGASETAVALRSAISNYVQATVENALDVRAGWPSFTAPRSACWTLVRLSTQRSMPPR